LGHSVFHAVLIGSKLLICKIR